MTIPTICESKCRAVSSEARPIEADDATICAKVRQTIVSDKCLSLNAQNIEISVEEGSVVLCGAVKSQEERSRIEIDAASVVTARIFNKLVVRSGRTFSQAGAARPQSEELSTEEECGRIRRQWGIRQG